MGQPVGFVNEHMFVSLRKIFVVYSHMVSSIFWNPLGLPESSQICHFSSLLIHTLYMFFIISMICRGRIFRWRGATIYLFDEQRVCSTSIGFSKLPPWDSSALYYLWVISWPTLVFDEIRYRVFGNVKPVSIRIEARLQIQWHRISSNSRHTAVRQYLTLVIGSDILFAGNKLSQCMEGLWMIHWTALKRTLC